MDGLGVVAAEDGACDGVDVAGRSTAGAAGDGPVTVWMAYCPMSQPKKIATADTVTRVAANDSRSRHAPQKPRRPERLRRVPRSAFSAILAPPVREIIPLLPATPLP